MKKKLEKLFDYQRFEMNVKLQNLIDDSLQEEMSPLLSDEMLAAVAGGISYNKVKLLEGKLEEYYKKGLITFDDYLDVHQALLTGDDYKIQQAIIQRISNTDGPWNELLHLFRNH